MLLNSQDLLYHATGYSSIGFFHFLGHGSHSSEMAMLKAIAIRKVNKSLTSPELAVHDSNIASVVCLAFGALFEVGN